MVGGNDGNKVFDSITESVPMVLSNGSNGRQEARDGTRLSSIYIVETLNGDSITCDGHDDSRFGTHIRKDDGCIPITGIE
jgi:hypothetical protein